MTVPYPSVPLASGLLTSAARELPTPTEAMHDAGTVALWKPPDGPPAFWYVETDGAPEPTFRWVKFQ